MTEDRFLEIKKLRNEIRDGTLRRDPSALAKRLYIFAARDASGPEVLPEILAVLSAIDDSFYVPNLLLQVVIES